MARSGRYFIAAVTIAAGALAAGVTSCRPSLAACSVLGRHPCIPQHVFCGVLSRHPCVDPCGVFRRHPCTRDVPFPFGEQLQLTIESQPSRPVDAADHDGSSSAPTSKLATIRDVFAMLRSCWVPPAEDHAASGTQISVRLSFKRNGEVFGEPRVTYLSPGTSGDVRQVYWGAVMDAFKRCTPLPFTSSLGGALAGRPFAIRFVDNRGSPAHQSE